MDYKSKDGQFLVGHYNVTRSFFKDQCITLFNSSLDSIVAQKCFRPSTFLQYRFNNETGEIDE